MLNFKQTVKNLQDYRSKKAKTQRNIDNYRKINRIKIDIQVFTVKKQTKLISGANVHGNVLLYEF